MKPKRGKSGRLRLGTCLAALFSLALPPVADAEVETRATVRSDFVTAYAVEPEVRQFPAGTELDYRASLGDAFLVEDPGAAAGPAVLAVPKEREGSPVARLVDGRVRIEADLEVTVERGYRVFPRGAVFTVSGREGDNLLIATGGDGPGATVRVPAGRFSIERVLASPSTEGSDGAGRGDSEEAKAAYALELQSYLEAHPPAAEPEAVDKPGDAVCVIETAGGTGTGFLFVMDSRVYCLTNHHVVGGARDLAITTADGDTFTPLFYEVARDRDLARILIEEQPPALTRMAEAAYGDPVRVVGNRGGVGVLRAEESEVIGFASGIIELKTDFAPGNSGSPVVKDDGGVVGLATFRLSARDEVVDGKSVPPGEQLFEQRYFATRLEPGIEWVPASPGLLQRIDRSVAEDERFTREAFAILDHLGKNPFFPISRGSVDSRQLSQWSERLNRVLQDHRQQAREPGRQFVSYEDYQNWQEDQAEALVRSMGGLLDRLQHLARSRLLRMKTRAAHHPGIGYYPMIEEDLVERYELLIEVTQMVAATLDEAVRRPDATSP